MFPNKIVDKHILISQQGRDDRGGMRRGRRPMGNMGMGIIGGDWDRLR